MIYDLNYDYDEQVHLFFFLLLLELLIRNATLYNSHGYVYNTWPKEEPHEVICLISIAI